MSDDELSALREQIAQADRSVLEALERRLSLSLARRPQLVGRQAQDVGRGAWIDDLLRHAGQQVPREVMRSLLMHLRAEAAALEQPARVAYSGPEGGLAHQVALAQFGHAAELIECANTGLCLEEVERGRAAFAVFPFESSEEGLSKAALDALAVSPLTLIAESRVASRYDVLSHTGNLADVEKIYLTAAARLACSKFLRAELPKATVFEVRSPMVALQLARSDAGGAAIVPSGGDPGELQLARGNMGDEPELRYRFGVAAARPTGRSGVDVTALLFSVNDTAGALFNVLRHFAERDVNLRMLQSRPVHGQSWDYLFYVELSGHITDRALVTAIESVKRSTGFLKVLGSFPIEQPVSP